MFSTINAILAVTCAIIGFIFLNFKFRKTAACFTGISMITAMEAITPIMFLVI